MLHVGGGRAGLALSRITATVDFHVVVLDDRPDLETFVNNLFAHTKHSIPYDKIGDIIGGNGRKYFAIVTTACKSDAAALKVIARMDTQYIGLMGSSAKSKQIFDLLKAEGITDAQLQRIHTPIGVPISSHIPEEIAVSIAAEIIKTRNESNQLND